MRLKDCTADVQNYVVNDRLWPRQMRIDHAKMKRQVCPIHDREFWDQVIKVNEG
jgi:hypothetical protein